MLETMLLMFLVDGAMHITWDIIIDRNKTLRRIAKKETISESTKLLIKELQRSGAIRSDINFDTSDED